MAGSAKTWLILLRGVMPTGRNKVPMAALRTALQKAGLDDVQTYIQSGNVVARSPLGRAELELLVHEVIARKMGGDIPVMARTLQQMRQILAGNPFADADPKRTYITLFSAKPAAALVRDFLALGHDPHRIEIAGEVAYTLVATQYNQLKANNNFMERKLKVAATTRVYNTIAQLVELGSA